MNAIITSVSELINLLTDLFRLSALFPALFFVLLNRFFVAPHFQHAPLVNGIIGNDLKDQALIAGASAILLGYTLNAIEVQIVRFFEGYPWRESWPGRFLTGWQLGRMDELRATKSSLQRQYDYVSTLEAANLQLQAKIGVCEAELDKDFPEEPEWVLPTKLGNVIAAFEAYPRKYGIDGIVLWTRILPILDQEGFSPYVTEARSTTDFLLNTSLLVAVFGIECVSLRILFLPDISWVLVLGAFAIAVLFYGAAIASAYSWGVIFCTAFDLFRYHLAGALGLKPVTSLKLEQKMWRDLTKFLSSRQQAEFKHFHHTQEAWPVGSSGNGEERK